MIQQIMRDPLSWICTLGILFVQWVMAHASTLVGLMMGIGGVISVYLSVQAQRKKNKLLDMEIRQREQARIDRNNRRRKR